MPFPSGNTTEPATEEQRIEAAFGMLARHIIGNEPPGMGRIDIRSVIYVGSEHAPGSAHWRCRMSDRVDPCVYVSFGHIKDREARFTVLVGKQRILGIADDFSPRIETLASVPAIE